MYPAIGRPDSSVPATGSDPSAVSDLGASQMAPLLTVDEHLRLFGAARGMRLNIVDALAGR